jgi:hypothetical protein
MSTAILLEQSTTAVVEAQPAVLVCLAYADIVVEVEAGEVTAELVNEDVTVVVE